MVSSRWALCCLLCMSSLGIHHAFVTPAVSVIGNHNSNIMTVAAVKKSFDRKTTSSDSSSDKLSKRALFQKLRIRRRTKPQDTIVTPTGPATQYIPSGMTLEEYNALKQKEALEESTKDYGAWGPRFARTGRPDGDWMVLPQLWTMGAVDRPAGGVGGGKDPSRTPLQRLRQQLPALILSTVLWDSMITAFTMYKAAAADWLDMLVIDFRLPIFLIANATKWKQVALIQFSRIHAVKALVVFLSAPLLDKYFLAKVNRYRLWSKRRTVTLSTLGSMGVLGLWALVLRTLKWVGMI